VNLAAPWGMEGREGGGLRIGGDPGEGGVVAGEVVGESAGEAGQGFAMVGEAEVMQAGLGGLETEIALGVGGQFDFAFVGGPEGGLDVREGFAAEECLHDAGFAGGDEIQGEAGATGDAEVGVPTGVEVGKTPGSIWRGQDGEGGLDLDDLMGLGIGEGEVV